MMNNSTFKDKAAGEYFNNNLISMKIDMEQEKARNLRMRYGVRSRPYPLLFINPKGEVVPWYWVTPTTPNCWKKPKKPWRCPNRFSIQSIYIQKGPTPVGTFFCCCRNRRVANQSFGDRGG